jgi:hypothetical protein
MKLMKKSVLILTVLLVVVAAVLESPTMLVSAKTQTVTCQGKSDSGKKYKVTMKFNKEGDMTKITFTNGKKKKSFSKFTRVNDPSVYWTEDVSLSFCLYYTKSGKVSKVIVSDNAGKYTGTYKKKK